MNRHQPISIDDRNFKTRRDVRRNLRRVRNKWRFKGPITSARDHAFLLELFNHHPNAHLKAPNGVRHFEVGRSPDVEGQHPSSCFWVTDNSGATTDFSTNKALKSAYEAHNKDRRQQKGNK